MREFVLKGLLMGFQSGLQNFIAMTVFLIFLDEMEPGENALVGWLVLAWVGSMFMVVVTPLVSVVDAVWSFFGRNGDQTPSRQDSRESRCQHLFSLGYSDQPACRKENQGQWHDAQISNFRHDRWWMRSTRLFGRVCSP